MSRSYDEDHSVEANKKALRLIRARIQGVWDDPELVEFGGLNTDITSDIAAMLELPDVDFDAEEDTEESEDSLEPFGLCLVTRAEFMESDPAEFAFIRNEDTLAALRERVNTAPGSFVVYDPEDDGDGWLLVGDDPDELARASVKRFEDDRALFRLGTPDTTPAHELPVKNGPVVITLDHGDKIEIIERFATISDAESFLSLSASIDPDDLEAGNYGIDAPHGVGNDAEAVTLARNLGLIRPRETDPRKALIALATVNPDDI